MNLSLRRIYPMILAGILLGAASSRATLVMSFDFDDASQDTIAELESLGWSFTGGTEVVIAPGDAPESALRLGGNTNVQPTASFTFSETSATGSVSMLVGTSDSFSNARMSIRSGTTELFALTMNNTSNIGVVASTSFATNVAAAGLSVDDAGEYDSNRVQVDFSWVGTTLSYTLEQPGSGTLFATGTVSFAAAGIPDNFYWSQGTYNNSSRQAFLFDIQVTAIPEPGSVALFALGSLAVLVARRRIARR